jgi:hypothetical protein
LEVGSRINGAAILEVDLQPRIIFHGRQLVWIILTELENPAAVAGGRIAALALKVKILELAAHAVFAGQLIANGVFGCEGGCTSKKHVAAEEKHRQLRFAMPVSPAR